MDSTSSRERPLIITRDGDKSLGYEFTSLARKVVNVFLIPLLNHLPVSIRSGIRRSHRSADTVIRHATQFQALEALYNYGFPDHTQSVSESFFHRIWFSSNNAIAVRNRLRLVKRELKSAYTGLYDRKGALTILSIASGSARAIAESLHETRLGYLPDVDVTFLDKDPAALEYSKDLVKKFNLTCNTRWISATAGTHLRSYCGVPSFDIVEMVGLLDYFDNDRAEQLMTSIYDALKEDGVFIVANINHNSERQFISRVIGWNMIYRTPSELADLVVRSGFRPAHVTGFVEPLKIHTLVVARKSNA